MSTQTREPAARAQKQRPARRNTTVQSASK